MHWRSLVANILNLQDKGDPNAKDAFTAASKDAMDANSAYMTQQKTDMAAFTSDTSKPQGISFPDWASLNDPNLQILSQNRDALTSKLQQARLQYLGSDAGQLNNYFTNANSANTQTRFPEAGYVTPHKCPSIRMLLTYA